MDFNLSWSNNTSGQNPSIKEENLLSPEPIQAQGNLTYLEAIDVIGSVWKRAHPEIYFIPFSDNNIYDPDFGYIVYSLVERTPKQNNPKPRYMRAADGATSSIQTIIFTQSFVNSVKFTAVHKNPRVAEEIIEAFEDDMYIIIPTLKRLGLEDIMYGKRAADESKTRFGENLAARTIVYMMVTQKVITTDIDRLQEVYIQAQAPRYNYSIELDGATPNSGTYIELYDNHATPSTYI